MLFWYHVAGEVLTDTGPDWCVNREARLVPVGKHQIHTANPSPRTSSVFEVGAATVRADAPGTATVEGPETFLPPSHLFSSLLFISLSESRGPLAEPSRQPPRPCGWRNYPCALG